MIFVPLTRTCVSPGNPPEKLVFCRANPVQLPGSCIATDSISAPLVVSTVSSTATRSFSRKILVPASGLPRLALTKVAVPAPSAGGPSNATPEIRTLSIRLFPVSLVAPSNVTRNQTVSRSANSATPEKSTVCNENELSLRPEIVAISAKFSPSTLHAQT